MFICIVSVNNLYAIPVLVSAKQSEGVSNFLNTSCSGFTELTYQLLWSVYFPIYILHANRNAEYRAQLLVLRVVLVSWHAGTFSGFHSWQLTSLTGFPESNRRPGPCLGLPHTGCPRPRPCAHAAGAQMRRACSWHPWLPLSWENKALRWHGLLSKGLPLHGSGWECQSPTPAVTRR